MNECTHKHLVFVHGNAVDSILFEWCSECGALGRTCYVTKGNHPFRTEERSTEWQMPMKGRK